MPNFNSFDAMAAHFARVVAGLPTARHEALDAIGLHVETTAKAKLGEYQAQAGPFSAWAQLAEGTLANKARQAATGGADSPLLITGAHIRDTITHRVVVPAVHIGSDDEVVDYQERGTNRIPPRSFLGASLFEQTEWCQNHFMGRVLRLIETGA